MANPDDPSARAAAHVLHAERMRLAAERAVDDDVAAQYRTLAASWLRLAEEAQRHALDDDQRARIERS